MLARKRVHGYGLMLTVNPSQVRSGSCKTKKPKHCSQWACAHMSKKSLLSSSHLSLRYVENKKTGPWGYVILWENRGGSVGSTFDSGLMCCRFESHLRNWTFRLSPQCSATGKSKALVCPASSMRLGIEKITCHLSQREGDCLPVVGFLLVSFIK